MLRRLGRIYLFYGTGLSADTSYADRIAELQCLTFLTNSDAHSPYVNKLAREFNRFKMENISFDELKMAIIREKEENLFSMWECRLRKENTTKAHASVVSALYNKREHNEKLEMFMRRNHKEGCKRQGQ